ncbi:TBC1 domain family member 2B [Schistosoma japonicum]|nr:TBC1 domain family member 2B [Schistosoma japonicum]
MSRLNDSDNSMTSPLVNTASDIAAYFESAFKRLKGSQRHWYVFEESTLRLLAYRNEMDAAIPDKEPLKVININGAVFHIDPAEHNQFSIMSEGKEHILQAETEDAMLLWLHVLQTRRNEAVQSNDSESSSTNDDNLTDYKLFHRNSFMKMSSSLPHVNDRCLNDKQFLCMSKSNNHLHNRVEQSPRRIYHRDVMNTPIEEENEDCQTDVKLCKDNGLLNNTTTSDFVSTDEVNQIEKENHNVLKITSVPESQLIRQYSSPTEYFTSQLSAKYQSPVILQNCLTLNDNNMDVENELSQNDYIRELKSQLQSALDREACLRQMLTSREAGLREIDQKVETNKLRDMIEDYDQKQRILNRKNQFLITEIRELATIKYMFTDHTNKMSNELLDEARRKDPSLPSMIKPKTADYHVDFYGFKHSYLNETSIIHYSCQQLYSFYTRQLSGGDENFYRWTELLTQANRELTRADLEVLCRSGVPIQYREGVWRMLIHGELNQLMQIKGPLYYNGLLEEFSENTLATQHRRQISLDLLRTMPNNVQFDNIEAPGVQKLQEVLQAYSIHNAKVGYCQGMNFIAAIALLFLKKEDAFWCLIAILEHFLPEKYFHSGLIDAQVDQLVLKEIVNEKLPLLSNHLKRLGIDISAVTLNWFLAIFYDSVPFETLLRIWDVFLLEGSETLFRFAVAILKRNEDMLLEQTDTISFWKCLKAATRLTYDKMSIKKGYWQNVMQESADEYGENHLESRVSCICAFNNEIILLGMMSKQLCAYSVRQNSKLWQIPIHDSVTDLTSAYFPHDHTNKVYAGLTNGELVVIEISISNNPLDVILKICLGENGVWIAVRGSSIIELWDPEIFTRILLFNIANETYLSRRPEEEYVFNPQRVTVILPYENTIWVGTGMGERSMSLKDELYFDGEATWKSLTKSSRSPSNPDLTHMCIDDSQLLFYPLHHHHHNSTVLDKDVDSTWGYQLQKIVRSKVAETPVRFLVMKNALIISCSTYFNDDDAVLKWQQDKKDNLLWTNEPIYVFDRESRSVRLPAYMRNSLCLQMHGKKSIIMNRPSTLSA